MNRSLAMICALLLAFLTVSTTCLAAPSEWISFTLEPEAGGNGNQVHANFRSDRTDSHHEWSSGFLPSELIGLDISGFRGSGSRPLRFAIIREAGRLDCSGSGGESFAHGNCSFTPDQAFAALLASKGIRQPDREEAFGLMAVNVRRELIDAISAARYPTPRIDDLLALSALGANGRYILELAQAGYRPNSLDSLVQFKALAITPEWIGGFTRLGYGGLPPGELVQLKALGVTPEYVSAFDRIGYRHLPADTLVQLKALDISPEFVRSVVGERGSMPPVQELVEMKIFGRKR